MSQIWPGSSLRKQTCVAPTAVTVHACLNNLSQRVEIGSAMREHYSFGITRCARGIVDRDGLFFVFQPARNWLCCTGCEKLLVGIIRSASVVNLHNVNVF